MTEEAKPEPDPRSKICKLFSVIGELETDNDEIAFDERPRKLARAMPRPDPDKRKWGLLLCLLVLAAGEPVAAAEGTYAVLGVGNTSCGDWTYFHEHAGEKDPLHSRMDLIESAWFDGFVSSYNDYGMAKAGNAASGLDIVTLEAWISDYCRAHPNDSIAVASGALITELQDRRAQSK